MIVGERIAAIRKHKRLQSKELAALAGVSAAELSYIESRARNPKTDTLQKIAAALEVTTSYLLGEVFAGLSLDEALALESLKIFFEQQGSPSDLEQVFNVIARGKYGPQTVDGWRRLVEILLIYDSSRVSGSHH